MTPTLVLFLLFASGGAVVLAAGIYDRLFAGNAASAFLATLDEADVAEDEFVARLRQPLKQRMVETLRASTGPLLGRITPKGLVLKMKHDLMLAGMSDRVRPEEMVTLQVVLGALGLMIGLAFMVTGSDAGKGLLVLILLPTMGALGPAAIVKRKAAERSEAIFRDLPDCLDLLAISVEAGVGFEAALDVVCKNFDSALAMEFRRTLKEMELGVGRRDALANLRARTDVPELSNFIMALTQADALGMPIGRVLHTQAIELRNRRRQWAREKAAKLPVKILFPLVLFIFPGVLVVILGPAMSSIMEGMGGV